MDLDSEIVYSIIVVCLNAGERLTATVESIVRQQYGRFEVIVKDGGSTDLSVERMQERCSDDRIQIYSQADTGIYDAMNQAVRLAQGEYYLFLNAGDCFYDDRVLEMVTEEIAGLREQGRRVDVLYGNLYHRMLGVTIYAAPQINEFTCYRNVPCHQTCFYHKSLFAVRSYDTNYSVRADYEHFLWCYYKRRAAFWYVPVLIASYEGGGYSETKENKKRSARQHREIVVRYMGRRKADKYRFILLVTLAPLRRAIADSKSLSGVYNGLKTVFYKARRTKGKGSH